MQGTFHHRVTLRILIFLSVMISPQTDAKEGVILLHGLCRSAASMNQMATALATAGYEVDNIDYPSRSAGITQLSQDVIGSAMHGGKLDGCSKIHFVTHSLGGILVRSYFSRHRDARLGRVVMLGPPNQGSEVVDRLQNWRVFQWLNGPAGRELGTGTDALPRQLGHVTFELGVIAGDRSTNWINSLMIADRDDGKVSIESTRVVGMHDHLVVHATHPYLMKKPEVIAATLRFLQSGTFAK